MSILIPKIIKKSEMIELALIKGFLELL